MKICILSQQHFRNKHVSEDTVNAFELAILKLKNVGVKKIEINELIYKFNRKSNNAVSLKDIQTLKKACDFAPDMVFLMAMSPAIIKYQKSLLRSINSPKIVYCIDTWESRLPEWKDVLEAARIDYVLCSNKKSVEVMGAFCKKAGYLPYSMNGDIFHPRNVKKEHLFMQMGRKNSTLNLYALRYIEEHGLSDSDYIREKTRGQILYPRFDQLAEEISRTWFFILAPRDVDESNITGAISDVTARFYEGMACKTLLLGYKPKDTFDILFPNSNSMVDIDTYEEFEKQVDHYLSTPEKYKDLVDRNFEFLMKNHTWSHRADTLLEFINNLEL